MSAFEKAPSLLKFIDLENYLSERIGIKVDLAIEQVFKPRIAENIWA